MLSLLIDSPIAAVRDVISGAVMVLFVLSAFLVIVIVLLQEGKGGGLAGAFGGAGAETFGVKAGTVNKFTAWLAALFLGLALLHAGLSSEKRAAPKEVDTSPFDTSVENPGTGGGDTGDEDNTGGDEGGGDEGGGGGGEEK